MLGREWPINHPAVVSFIPTFPSEHQQEKAPWSMGPNPAKEEGAHLQAIGGWQSNLQTLSSPFNNSLWMQTCSCARKTPKASSCEGTCSFLALRTLGMPLHRTPLLPLWGAWRSRTDPSAGGVGFPAPGPNSPRWGWAPDQNPPLATREPSHGLLARARGQAPQRLASYRSVGELGGAVLQAHLAPHESGPAVSHGKN